MNGVVGQVSEERLADVVSNEVDGFFGDLMHAVPVVGEVIRVVAGVGLAFLETAPNVVKSLRTGIARPSNGVVLVDIEMPLPKMAGRVPRGFEALRNGELTQGQRLLPGRLNQGLSNIVARDEIGDVGAGRILARHQGSPRG